MEDKTELEAFPSNGTQDASISKQKRKDQRLHASNSEEHGSIEVDALTASMHRYSLRNRSTLNPSTAPFVPGFTKSAQAQAVPQETSATTKNASVPKPSETYIRCCQESTGSLNHSQPLLVILDLNGTLLFRKKLRKNGTRPTIARPYLEPFLEWLLTDSPHSVMIWSSVRPDNMKHMIDSTMKAEHAEKFIATWGRDTLHLGKKDYKQKVQVYKRLEWVWSDSQIQAHYPKKLATALGILPTSQHWGQHNTLLIDDSLEKTASEPYNHIHVPEYMGSHPSVSLQEGKENILGQVRTIIDQASYSANTSNFLWCNPPALSLETTSQGKTELDPE